MESHYQTTADGVDTLYSEVYQQTYHSSHGALREAEHVFLQASGVGQRLAQGISTSILEVGFGTGLNFWLTVQHSRLAQTSVRYLALEKNLLPAELLAALNHADYLPLIGPLRQAFLDWRGALPEPLPSVAIWAAGSALELELELRLGEATEADLPHGGYQAIYHDAFSPDVNPELWTQGYFARLYACLEVGGKLTTYSAKGDVRRALQAVGFQVERRPGPPGKREMLVATRG